MNAPGMSPDQAALFTTVSVAIAEDQARARRNAIEEALAELEAAAAMFRTLEHNAMLERFAGDAAAAAQVPFVPFGIAVGIERAVRRALEQLQSEPIDSLADAVHDTAVEAAARICDGRARSQQIESKSPLCALEATKCAAAIRQRLHARDALRLSPELSAPRGGAHV
jgi:hypothetical protein